MKPMPLLRVFAVLYVLCVSTPSFALDFRNVTFHPPTAIDTLRDEARLARIERRWADAESLQAVILERHPGDPFALVETSVLFYDRGDELTLLAALERGDLSRVPGGRHLGASGVDFLRALVEYSCDRYRTALPLFDRAAAARPDDGWIRLYRGLTRMWLLEPADGWEPDLQHALGDPDAAPVFMKRIINRPNNWPDSTVDAAAALLPRLAGIPWVSELPDFHAASMELMSGPLEAAEYESLWVAFTRRHGNRTEDLAYALSGTIGLDLSPDELGEFFDRRVAGDDSSIWLFYRINLLDGLAFSDRSRSLALAELSRHPDLLALALRLTGSSDSAERLEAGAGRLIRRSLWAPDVRQVASIYNDLGRSEESRAVFKLLRDEYPLQDAERRLDDLVISNPAAARALADSLNGLGFGGYVDGNHGLDLASPEEKLSPELYRSARSRNLAIHSAWSAVTEARESGRAPAAAALKEWLREVTRNHIGIRVEELGWALSTRDADACGRLLDELERLAPGSPLVIEGPIHMDLALGRTDSARDRLTGARRKVADFPATAARLVYPAWSIDMKELAHDFLEMARKASPEDREIRLVGAWLDLQEHRTDAALAALQDLTREFPGRESYRTLLISAGGGTQSLSDFQSPASNTGVDFSLFGHDLESVDWILEAMGDADTLRGVDAVYLAQRSSYIASSTRDLNLRRRDVLRILGPEAIERYQPKRISFHPLSGVPKVVQARVIHPDGRIVAVKPGDIVVAGSESEADVSEELQVVIPFRDLGVGDIIDVTWEQALNTLSGGGWSVREMFVAEVPVREHVLEIVSRSGYQVHQGEGVPISVDRPAGDLVCRSWTRRSFEAPVFEAMSTGVYANHPWVGLTSNTSWSEAGEDVRQAFLTQAVISDSVRSLATDLARGRQTTLEKVEALHRHLVDNVRYLAVQLGRGAVVPSRPQDVLGRGYGDCKDMVTTLHAMLAALKIESRPVLVTTGGLAATAVPDFVEVKSFTHVILEIPALGERAFCDPTSGAPAGLLAPGICDSWGLALNPGGPAELIRIPAASAADHGFNIEATLQPVSAREAEIALTARYRGEPGLWMIQALRMADTSTVSVVIDRTLAFGFSPTCRRISWKVVKEEPAAVTISAVYRDTAWAVSDQSSVTAAYNTEVADPFLIYPPPAGRKTDVRIDYPFECDYLLRLKDGAGWEVVDDVVEVSVKGEFHEGRTRKTVSVAGGGHEIAVSQHFAVRRADLPIGKYKAFYDDWFRFSACVAQPYTFRKSLSDAETRRLMAYAASHPDDYGFAVQAAQKILGTDLGGRGEAGTARRKVAGELLEKVCNVPESGSNPIILLSGIRMGEGRYIAADSMLTVAAQREPSSVFVKALLIGVKSELGDVTGQLALMDEFARNLGNKEVLLSRITLLYGSRQFEAARSAEEHYLALHGDADSSAVLPARLAGYLRANACSEARQVFEQLSKQTPPEGLRTIQHDYYLTCDQNGEVLRLLETLWSEQPLNSFVCNGLAWQYALQGIELDHAEELAQSAMILNKEDASVRNTLGAIYARRGLWDKARQIFESILETEERPMHRVVNEYFVGLCDYQTGKKTEAVERWKRALEITPYEYQWNERIQKSIDLSAGGGDVTKAIFVAGP